MLVFDSCVFLNRFYSNSPKKHLKYVSGADQVNLTHTFEVWTKFS